MTGAAIYYHLKATKLEVGNHTAQSPEWIYQCHHSGLYPRVRTSPHLVGLASPQMSIPSLHLGGHRGGTGIGGAVVSRTVGLGTS